MKYFAHTVIIAACMATSSAHAATMSLLDFREIPNDFGRTIIVEEAASLAGQASMYGNVVDLLSFEWRLIDSNAGGGFAYLQTTVGAITTNIVLAATGSPEFGAVNTYTFAKPFTGSLLIGMGSGDTKYRQAMLEVDKFEVRSTSPVPEPETFGMLLGGLGILGLMARRRIGSRRQSKTNQARMQMRMAG